MPRPGRACRLPVGVETGFDRGGGAVPHRNIDRRIRGLKCLVGNTPLLAIDFKFRGEQRVLYAKAEHINMTGSIKDRMALFIM